MNVTTQPITDYRALQQTTGAGGKHIWHSMSGSLINSNPEAPAFLSPFILSPTKTQCWLCKGT